MRKRMIAFLLFLTLTLLSSCGNESADESIQPEDIEQTTQTTNGNNSVPQELLLVHQKKSEYVIVCNFKDSVSKEFANDFADLMFSMFGVSFDTRSESSSYDKEIVIGETSRSATVGVRAQMSEKDDFAVCAMEDDLVLYATDELQYQKMLIALRDYIFADTKTDELRFSMKNNFVSSMNPNMDFVGNTVVFAENGRSSYSIVYAEGDSDSITYAIYLKEYLSDVFGLSVPILADSKQATKEIILKGADRTALKVSEKELETEDDFTVSVINDDVIVSGTDNEHMVLAMMKLVEWCESGFNGTAVKLNEIDSYVYSKQQRSFEYSAKELCQRYQSIYNTYSTYHEDKLYNSSWLPQSAKDDQKLVDALIDRMGQAFAIKNGSSSVLYDGFVRKLDKQDYTRSAVIENGRVKIPVEFARSYFGDAITADGNSYVDITEYVANDSKYTIYVSSDGRLAVVTPSSIAPFSNQIATDGKYTNQQYCDRMLEFFHSSVMPEPDVNTEQSRVVVEYVEYPQYVLDFKTNEYQTTYSPSIVVVSKNGQSVYYVSYEISTVVNYEELATYTVVKKSVDGGNTWTTVVEKIPNLRWASIFENKGVIYLLGSNIYTNKAVIVKVGANGTYQQTTLFGVADTQGTAPGTVLHANGRIYKAYHVTTVSASEDADLMQQSSWTLSGKTSLDSLAPMGAEGSMVLGKDGQIYQIMHTDKTQSAYVLKLSADGKTYTATKPSKNNVISFPTCISKTSVIYDAVSEKYIALSNICNTPSERQRNVLALVVSDDLYTWEIAEYILVEREMVNPLYSATMHAYQYTDFKIDGDDIVMVVREASGYTNTYHDGNYTTFYRISDFRELLDNAKGEYPS